MKEFFYISGGIGIANLLLLIGYGFKFGHWVGKVESKIQFMKDTIIELKTDFKKHQEKEK